MSQATAIGIERQHGPAGRRAPREERWARSSLGLCQDYRPDEHLIFPLALLLLQDSTTSDMEFGSGSTIPDWSR
ncbi:uncharacterized protein BDCG_17250 [Blastomyces dermatitidis ER-3]|uniref:Uncharacterized protein n=2 Tax=Ajellomyces dermatitidis TaxID=5039 RepID=A0A0J9EN63_AJEDA|nr:uncharacterized protein BDCG_17250 [Blastomyces dermatitidis ER-3]EQL36110.1 hypothetical protein BDFG_02362 [Blastomyces dermatitidis ATCC 26199]KMW67718.1 hypothetical protein BDDG_12272 [Blastomyces dermatitidis ATCC 18188]OAT01830.1 hypothetical protein BDCG_17250 [Blastomyces dermatitidis ER-3]